MLSGSVHSSVGDLDQHFRENQENHKLELLTEPVTDGLDGALLILAETMVGLAQVVGKVFSLSARTECEGHLAALHNLYSAG
jgi:hypothetical protein